MTDSLNSGTALRATASAALAEGLARPASTALLTDHYELTMVQAALDSGAASRRAVFEVFARHLPHGRRYGVVAGTGRLLDAIGQFRFGPAEIEFLRESRVVNETTLSYLSSYRFGGNIWGYAEGDLYFPGSPILVVEGSFGEAVLLETVLLSILNHDCAVASAASRMVTAAGGRSLIEMGSRRTHETAAIAAARAAHIAGFGSTSNLAARLVYGVPSSGTAAHAFTLVHDSEKDAFRAQVSSLGSGTTLLVDTFDVASAVSWAVSVAGTSLGAVRVDSGDLAAVAFAVRSQLDSLGATSTRIILTGDLDEYSIAGLGVAPVDGYGVGTSLVTGSGAPTAALVYKLVARSAGSGPEAELLPVAKRSVGKPGRGGRKWAVREAGPDGLAATERILLQPPGPGDPGGRVLLRELVRSGTVVGREPLAAARARHQEALAELPPYALQLSRGYPAIPTVFGKNAEEAELAGNASLYPAAMRRRQLLTTAAWGLGFIAFLALNHRLSQTIAVNSDGASQALQGWDMLQGNLLQHGWITGDVAYFPTDVSVYALIGLAHGLNADMVHWYGTLMYTLAMLLAALLAMGPRATGTASAGSAITSRERWVRGAIAAGIMIAPQLDAGVFALLQGSDHFGTAVPVLLAWLILDRCPRRWHVAVAVAVILGVTGIADLTALFTGALPLAGVCAYRAARGGLWERQSLAAQRSEILLAGAGIVAGVMALEGPRILTAVGSLTQVAPVTAVAPQDVIFWHNFRVAGLCLLLLAGADFIGVHQQPRVGFEILHLAGAALGACAILVAAWRFLRDKDLIAQLLLAAILANLVTFVAGTHASEITFAREMCDVLPFTAVLTGRLLARRLLSLRLAPVLAVVLCGYLAGLGYEVRQPALPAWNSALIPWLRAHHLTYGLSGYWAANSVTLASGEQVIIRAVNGTTTLLPSGHEYGGLAPVVQLVQKEWYDPSHERANFVVFFPSDPGTEPFSGFTGMVGFTSEKNAINQFGPPAKIYRFAQYTIFVWNKNLLADMTFPPVHAAG